uniref:DUF4283 domain-containing protein n=1 Tax=Kalanchoe fedtschenkoi TaxID=63787 RepID=A0A7N0TVE2_KALFE
MGIYFSSLLLSFARDSHACVAHLRGVFLFEFSTRGNMVEVPGEGPWSYDNRLLAFKEWSPDEIMELEKIVSLRYNVAGLKTTKPLPQARLRKPSVRYPDEEYAKG